MHEYKWSSHQTISKPPGLGTVTYCSKNVKNSSRNIVGVKHLKSKEDKLQTIARWAINNNDIIFLLTGVNNKSMHCIQTIYILCIAAGLKFKDDRKKEINSTTTKRET